MTASDPGTSGCEEVCNLPDDERHDRVAMIRREILPHVTRREALANGVAFEFQYTPGMQKTLEDLVTFERDCCSGLAWDLRHPSDGVLRLSVEGLAPDSDFFRALDPAAVAAGAGRMARLAQSGALGGGAAFFLCCIAPIGVAAVFGAAVAAPLATLDNPLVIAASSVVFAMPVWLWLKRRASARSGAA